MTGRWTLAALLLLACDGGSGAPPEDTDPGPVSFAGEVQPIFDRSCASSGCHGGDMPQAGLDLRPEVSYAQLVDVPSEQVPALARVAPGDPDGSYLVHKLADTHLDVGGRGRNMPPGLGLAAGEVARIGRWIEEGAPEN